VTIIETGVIARRPPADIKVFLLKYRSAPRLAFGAAFADASVLSGAFHEHSAG
jgi:hypothetical protein